MNILHRICMAKRLGAAMVRLEEDARGGRKQSLPIHPVRLASRLGD
ncbi:MAG TPA: hypothetical protein VJV04_17190 [Nitrospiraceae bacterium]|nr:hypothetical protein [Nitrospiraceae bacterium]